MRFIIDWASLIVGSKFTIIFCFVLLCVAGQFSKFKPPGGLYLEGRFNGGAYFRNFTVILTQQRRREWISSPELLK